MEKIRVENELNKVSLTQLLSCLGNSEVEKAAKKYEGYSPMEFVTIYTAYAMCEQGLIDEKEKTQILANFKKYNNAIKTEYYYESDIKHEYSGNLEDKTLTIEDYKTLLVASSIRCRLDKLNSKRKLEKYGLPVVFKFDEFKRKYNGVKADIQYHGDDEIALVYAAVNRLFNHVLYEPTAEPTGSKEPALDGSIVFDLNGIVATICDEYRKKIEEKKQYN